MRTGFWILFALLLINTALGQGAPDIQWMQGGHLSPHLRDVEYSSGGLHVYTSGSDRTLKIWRTSDAAFVRTVPLRGGRIFAVAPDDSSVATFDSDNPTVVNVIRMSDGALLHTFAATNLVDVAYSPNSQYVAAAGTTSSRVWRLSDGQQVAALVPSGGGTPRTIRFSPNGQFVALESFGSPNRITLWRTSDWGEQQALTAVGSGTTFDFSPDSTHIIWQDGGVGVGIYQLSTNSMVRVLVGVGGVPYTFLRFSPDGSLVAGSHSSSLSIWRFSDGALLSTNQDGFQYRMFGFSPNGSQITAARMINNGSARWAEIRQENGQTYSQVSHKFTEFDYAPNLLTISPDGQYLGVSGIAARSADLRSTATGALLYRWPSNTYGSLAMTPDGTKLLIGKSNVEVYSIPSPTLLTTYPGTTGLQAVSVLPNGTHYIAGAGSFIEGIGTACDVHVRRLSDGSIDYQLGSHWEEVWGTGVSNDGRFAYSIDRHHTKIWDLSMRMITFTGPGGYRTRRPAFSIDSFFIALPVNGAIEVRRADGKLVRTIPIPGGESANCVAFNNTRSHVVAGVGSKIHIFRVKDMVLVKTYDMETGSGLPGQIAGGVVAISMHPDGLHFFYGRDDCTLVKAKLPQL